MGNLKYWAWLNYEKYIMCEYIQCKKEGHLVDDLLPFCKFVERNYDKRDVRKLGAALGELLLNSPIDPSFHYDEPSKLDEILSSRPQQTFVPVAYQNIINLKERITGAWLGRTAGCLLGKPIEGWRTNRLYPLLKQTNNYPMYRYIKTTDFNQTMIDELMIDVNSCWIDKVEDASPKDDDTTYTVLGLKMVETFGKDFTSEDALETWLRFLPIVTTCTAERYAYCNAAKGLLPPETAIYKNPYREFIGAQIRADFFGYVNPGNPEKAAKMAFNDASISHIKNGIYGEMWVAAMIAIAAVCDDTETIICKALEQIPVNCRLREDVIEVVHNYKNNLTEEESRALLHKKYDENVEMEWGYVVNNAAIVAHAILYGNKDFEKSICYAVQCGFDTDCNGATVGSVVGMMVGEKNIPARWYEPFHRKLITAVEGYNCVTIDELVDKTLYLIKN